MRAWEIIRALAKERIKEKRIMQKDLASQCGYSEQAFSMIINGRKPILDTDIEKLCKGLDVTPNKLLGFQDSA